MYVCICKAVTDKEIRRAAANGADSLHELREALGVGTGCGSCADFAQEILREHRTHGFEPTAYTPSPV